MMRTRRFLYVPSSSDVRWISKLESLACYNTILQNAIKVGQEPSWISRDIIVREILFLLGLRNGFLIQFLIPFLYCEVGFSAM
jgi:hypothetical protein